MDDKEKTFQTDMRQKASVERHNKQGTEIEEANFMLRTIGRACKETDIVLSKETTYLGSAAIHYYVTPNLQQPFFVTQTATIQGVPEPLVQQGITELRNELLQRYGHKAQRKRSGF